jgi:hypothetical protein
MNAGPKTPPPALPTAPKFSPELTIAVQMGPKIIKNIALT